MKKVLFVAGAVVVGGALVKKVVSMEKEKQELMKEIKSMNNKLDDVNKYLANILAYNVEIDRTVKENIHQK